MYKIEGIIAADNISEISRIEELANHPEVIEVETEEVSTKDDNDKLNFRKSEKSISYKILFQKDVTGDGEFITNFSYYNIGWYLLFTFTAYGLFYIVFSVFYFAMHH